MEDEQEQEEEIYPGERRVPPRTLVFVPDKGPEDPRPLSTGFMDQWEKILSALVLFGQTQDLADAITLLLEESENEKEVILPALGALTTVSAALSHQDMKARARVEPPLALRAAAVRERLEREGPPQAEEEEVQDGSGVDHLGGLVAQLRRERTNGDIDEPIRVFLGHSGNLLNSLLEAATRNKPAALAGAYRELGGAVGVKAAQSVLLSLALSLARVALLYQGETVLMPGDPENSGVGGVLVSGAAPKKSEEAA